MMRRRLMGLGERVDLTREGIGEDLPGLPPVPVSLLVGRSTEVLGPTCQCRQPE